MVNKTQKFRHHEIVRGLRAVAAAGVRDPTVQVCLPDGTRFVFGNGKPDDAVSTRVVGKGNKSVRSTEDSRPTKRGRR
jgi:hypothetical protein